MISELKGFETCTAVFRFNDGNDTQDDHWAVYLTNMVKRDPRGSGYGPYLKKIAIYAGDTVTSRLMAVNHTRALNAFLFALRDRKTLSPQADPAAADAKREDTLCRFGIK